MIKDRFGIDIEVDTGRILYKETIAKAVEGVGHYEPLRHYAEVHLLMEPLEPGSGLVFEADCSEDDLALNWQRLIMGHLSEKTHRGVLTGSPITDQTEWDTSKKGECPRGHSPYVQLAVCLLQILLPVFIL